jgi:flagellin
MGAMVALRSLNDTVSSLGSTRQRTSPGLSASRGYDRTTFSFDNAGAGSQGAAMVDADLAAESSRLQSLQVRQQLGSQALSIANQAPQSLMKLFG